MSLGLTNRRADPDPFARIKDVRGVELMGSVADRWWRIPANKAAAEFPFEYCPPCRMGRNYRFRVNYEGWYWVASTNQMVWFESLTELLVLMQLDHEGHLVAVATQPFAIVGDGYRHYLDIATLSADGTRMAIDVRPAHQIDDASARKFAFAGRVASEIGIGYEVRTGLTGWEATNLEWLSHFRQPRYALDPETRARLSDAVRHPHSLASLAATVLPDNEPRARAGIFHALWKRELVAATDGPFTNTTRIAAPIPAPNPR